MECDYFYAHVVKWTAAQFHTNRRLLEYLHFLKLTNIMWIACKARGNFEAEIARTSSDFFNIFIGTRCISGQWHYWKSDSCPSCYSFTFPSVGTASMPFDWLLSNVWICSGIGIPCCISIEAVLDRTHVLHNFSYACASSTRVFSDGTRG